MQESEQVGFLVEVKNDFNQRLVRLIDIYCSLN